MGRLVDALDRRALLTVTAVVLWGAAGCAALGWTLRDLRALGTELARERALDAGAADPVAVPPVSEEERELWRQLEERLRRRFPAEADLPRAVGTVADWARAAGLELVDLEIQGPGRSAATAPAAPAAPAPGPSGPPAPGRPLPALPPELAPNPSRFTLVARHRYRDLVTFVDGLGRLPVYVALEALEVRRADDRLTSELTFASLRWAP